MGEAAQKLEALEQSKKEEQQERAAQAQRAAASEAGLVARVSALREEMLAERTRLDMSLQVRAPPAPASRPPPRAGAVGLTRAIPRTQRLWLPSTKRLQYMFQGDVMCSRRCGAQLVACAALTLVVLQ